MTRENAKKFLPIIQAFANGEVIQVVTGPNTWIDREGELSFDNSPNSYRIKPKPREFWLKLGNVYPTLADADGFYPHVPPIHVREVID